MFIPFVKWFIGGDWYLVRTIPVLRNQRFLWTKWRWTRDSPGLFDVPYDAVLKTKRYKTW